MIYLISLQKNKNFEYINAGTYKIFQVARILTKTYNKQYNIKCYILIIFSKKKT